MSNYDDIPEYKRVPKHKPKTSYGEIDDSAQWHVFFILLLLIILGIIGLYLLMRAMPSPMDVYMSEYSKCITANLPVNFCKKLALESIR